MSLRATVGSVAMTIGIMEREHERFMIGQKAVFIRDGKCLIGEIFNRPGVWELPGGRLEKGEYREAAFRREIKEELGLDDFENLGVFDYELWYNDDGTPFCAIVNLIKNDTDQIILSEEHSNFTWISKDEISNYKFHWPVASRFIENGFKFYELLNKNNGR